jgi:hypothetical protein
VLIKTRMDRWSLQINAANALLWEGHLKQIEAVNCQLLMKKTSKRLFIVLKIQSCTDSWDRNFTKAAFRICNFAV